MFFSCCLSNASRTPSWYLEKKRPMQRAQTRTNGHDLSQFEKANPHLVCPRIRSARRAPALIIQMWIRIHSSEDFWLMHLSRIVVIVAERVDALCALASCVYGDLEWIEARVYGHQPAGPPAQLRSQSPVPRSRLAHLTPRGAHHAG